MSRMDVCDRCGAVIFEDEGSKLYLELHTPTGSIGVGRNGEKPISADLCKPCGETVAKIITTRIMTSGTSRVVFIDGRK